MNAKKFYLLIGIVFVLGLLPQRDVSADMGPKPSYQFQFVQEVDSTLVLGSWTLISCPDSECIKSDKVINIPGDRFTCETNTCHAILNPLEYQGNDYFQIEANFSDNKSRRSNIFKSSFFYAKFRVTIRGDSLFVEELEGSNPSLLSDPLRLFALSPLLIPVGCVVVIAVYFVLVVISNHIRTSDKETAHPPRKANTPLWAGILFFIFLGLMLNAATFLLTIIVEIALAFAYLKYAKMPLKKVINGVLLANIFTQPLFAFASTTVFTSISSVIFLEIIVWLAEAGIVNKIQDNQLPFKKILVLTFFLNAASFGIGLLLPI